MTNFRLHFEQLKASGDLPSPGGVALSLLRLTRKPDVSLSEIAHVVQADPSLSGKLVKCANLLKAGTRSIASISGALNLLGMNAARQLVISFSILASNRRSLCKNFDYVKFWSASLARAISAQMLCEREKVAAPEECFVGALLSDIGSLALASLYPEAYSEILSHDLSPEMLLESEKSAFETDHVELTAAMLEDWMLPPLFVDAACRDPRDDDFVEGSREQKLARIWHFSALLAEKFVAGEKSIVRSMPEFIGMAAELELEPEDLAAFSNEAMEKWREWCEIFEIPSLKLPSFEEMMAALPVEEHAAASEQPFRLQVVVAGEDMTELGWMCNEISSLGHKVDAELQAGDVRLTMGGEPTFVSIDDFEAGEWNADAVGPIKRQLADRLIRRLRDRFAPAGILHYGQGKWYPGETLPRWTFSL
ncbi:MAG TPA: transglutaminase family protein, partial [Burkholderiales bacterium]|nr:transglutaminase family protein [Burkholderiales bacterium]